MKRVGTPIQWQQTDLFREPKEELILPEEVLREASGAMADLLLGVMLPSGRSDEAGGRK